MKGNDPLLELIQTLNPSEKRYFKLYAARQVKGDQNKYVQVFEALDKSSGKEGAEIQQALLKIAGKSTLPRLKTYLKQLILKSLVAYRAESNLTAKVREILSMVEVLYEKSLLKQCRHQLEKAARLAKDHELFLMQLEICRWEVKLRRSFPEPGADPLFPEIRSEIEVLFEKWLNFRDYHALGVFLHLRTRQTGHVSVWEDLSAHPLLAGREQARSNRARMLYHRLSASRLLQDERNEEAIEHLKGILTTYEAQPQVLRQSYVSYLSSQRNLMLVCRYAGRYQEAWETGKLMWQRTLEVYGEKPSQGNINDHLLSVNALLDLAKEMGDLILASDLCARYGKLEAKFRDSINPLNHMAFHYLSGIIYFLQGQYRKAVKQLYWVTLRDTGPVRADLQRFARLLLLLAYFELGRLEVCENELRNTQRFLEQHPPQFALVPAVVQWYRRLLRLPWGGKGWRESLLEFKADLGPILASGEERKALYYFDFLTYVETRLAGTEMVSELARKVGG